MLSSRRTFILGATALALGAGGLVWRYNSQRAGPISLLQSLLDTLVPQDDYPSALTTGIDTAFDKQLAAQPVLADRAELLHEYLERTALTQHHKPFVELRIEQRENMLTQLLSKREQPPPLRLKTPGSPC